MRLDGVLEMQRTAAAAAVYDVELEEMVGLSSFGATARIAGVNLDRHAIFLI